MPNPWEGKLERRVSDHDTLTQLVIILDNHVKNFDSHVVSDKEDFKGIKGDILKLQKVVWTAAGIIIAVEALPTLLRLMHVLNK